MSSEDSSSISNKISSELDLIEKKVGQNPKIIIGILVGGLILTIIGFFERQITTIIGIVLPTYWSIKAIESPETEDDIQWLTYWSVYAVFSFFDLFAKFILKFIPFYFVLKLVFLIWCFMPNTKGATFIYKNLLSKYFKKYEGKFDKIADKFKSLNKKINDKEKEIINKDKNE